MGKSRVYSIERYRKSNRESKSNQCCQTLTGNIFLTFFGELCSSRSRALQRRQPSRTFFAMSSTFQPSHAGIRRGQNGQNLKFLSTGDDSSRIFSSCCVNLQAFCYLLRTTLRHAAGSTSQKACALQNNQVHRCLGLRLTPAQPTAQQKTSTSRSRRYEKKVCLFPPCSEHNMPWQ